MSSQRNQRRWDHQTVDHISDLPDTIISHILSFMPTKSAVSTSILSKRWKYLWTKTPVLDFTEMPRSCDEFGSKLTLQQKSNFNSFIDRVLLHNDVTNMQCLLLYLYWETDFCIKSWLSLLARRDIREIFIKKTLGFRSNPIELPADFLIKEKLVVLKLAGMFVVSEMAGVHLPNLETMHITFARLPSDELMKRLLSGCPQLKILTIQDGYDLTATNMLIESYSLKTFEIDMKHKIRIVINAPNLRCLKIKGMTPSIIGDLSLLVEANLNLYRDMLMDNVGALVREFSRVETLRLSMDLGLSLLEKPPIFSNLMYLEIVKDGNMYTLLECTPNLKFLNCLIVIGATCRFESKPPLKCMCSLERVEIFIFCYDSEDFGLQMIAYLLKFGVALKELNISKLQKNQLDSNDEIYQKLLMLPRSSAACRIKIGEMC